MGSDSTTSEKMELEAGNPSFQPSVDRRPRLDEPLPVRLVAVDDVRLPMPVGVEAALDVLYVGLLEFERLDDDPSRPAYRADNFILRFEPQEHRPIERDSLRAQGIEVRSLAEAEKKLFDAEIEYSRQRGVTPGQESLLLLDPAGNWIELIEAREIR